MQERARVRMFDVGIFGRFTVHVLIELDKPYQPCIHTADAQHRDRERKRHHSLGRVSFRWCAGARRETSRRWSDYHFYDDLSGGCGGNHNLTRYILFSLYIYLQRASGYRQREQKHSQCTTRRVTMCAMRLRCIHINSRHFAWDTK